jgi:hypothetical protein
MQSRTQPETVRGWERYLRAVIFFFFVLFVILLPYSIKGARYAWMAAFVLWLVDLVVGRKRMYEQPLVWPMLAYIVLSGISCIFSYEPYLSWPHMKIVCWVALIGTLFAQNLRCLSQVRTLIVLLLLSAASVAGFTAWQYLHGIGLRITSIGYLTPLHRAGLRPDDVVAAINGHSVYSPNDLAKALEGIPQGETVRVRFLRGLPVRRKDTFVRVEDFETALKTGTATFVSARPVRAQGTLGHYGILAEVMVPIGCLAWTLMLGSPTKQHWQQVAFGIIFLAITATVLLTQTRAALTGLLGGCGIAMLLMSSRRTRPWLVSLLLVLFLGAVFSVYHVRGLTWVDPRDQGTQFRLAMWKDGLRLAWRHPLFGVGMESIQNRWPEWNLGGYTQYQKFWNFHSDLVQIAAERGPLTLATWLWFVVAYLMYLGRLLPKMQERTRFGWAVLTGILAGFVAFLSASLVESSLNDDSLVMLLFFCFGVAVAMERMLREPGAIDVP